MNIFVLSYLIIYILSFFSMYAIFKWQERKTRHSPVYYGFVNVFFSYFYILIAYALFGEAIAKEIGMFELLFVALVLSAPLIFPIAFTSSFALHYYMKQKKSS